YCNIFLFFTATAPTEIYPLSLHDALPICSMPKEIFSFPPATTPIPSGRMVTVPMTAAPDVRRGRPKNLPPTRTIFAAKSCASIRSEEHTSELQSRGHLVCRLLLEKKTSII